MKYYLKLEMCETTHMPADIKTYTMKFLIVSIRNPPPPRNKTIPNLE